MTIAQTSALERIARVLAGLELSINGDGDQRSAADHVDRTWRARLNEANCVLHALREPDAAMAAVGDEATWTRMVRAALGEAITAPARETRTWADCEIYQKTLG